MSKNKTKNDVTVWRRDCLFYFVVPFMVSWMEKDFEITKNALLFGLTYGLLALKAKLSNGNPHESNKIPDHQTANTG